MIISPLNKNENIFKGNKRLYKIYALVYLKINNYTRAVSRQIKDLKTEKIKISFIKEINCALLSILRHEEMKFLNFELKKFFL